MHTLHSVLVGIAVLCLAPYSASAQQAEVPVYKDGDWWRVKMEFASPPGVSAAYQLQSFPEYLVKFETGKAKFMGVRGDVSKEIDFPLILAVVLGKPPWHGEMLRFPMRIGLTWSDQFRVKPPGLR